MGTHDLLQDSAGVTLRLDGDWTIQDASALREVLLDALSRNNELRVDISGVTSTDLSMFELLHAACQSAARDSKKFVRTGKVSEAVSKAAVLSGFVDHVPFRDFWKNEECHVQDDHDRG
ncbi:MAG: STAS domain-containing protein [Desulfovibrio sp.]|nr:STAS domain-containing protein [Desulfovibrio sp.]